MPAQVIANNCVHFDSLATHSPVNSEKYTAVLSVLVKEFENWLQHCKKSDRIFCVFETPLSVDINTLCGNY